MAFQTLPTIVAGDRPTGDDWAAVLAGITELRPLWASKTADETVNNSSALQDDDHLTVAVEASATYHFELRLSYTSALTPDLKWGFTYPSGTTIRHAGTDADTTGAIRVAGNLLETSVPAICGSGGDLTAVYTGRIITSTTAGSVRIQWAQNSANLSNSTVYTGSFLRLTKVA